MTQQKLKLLPILDWLGEGEALKLAAGSTFVEKWANVSHFRDLQYFVWRLADLNYGKDCEATKMADEMYAASRRLGVPLTLAHFQVPGYAERAQSVLVEAAVQRNCAIPATDDDEATILYTPSVEAVTLDRPSQRPETGPMQFGDDWPGYFMRGDNAVYLGMLLGEMLTSMEPQDNPQRALEISMLRGLAEGLQSADVHLGASVQKLQPFAQCLESK
jgi:hypothetical protein